MLWSCSAIQIHEDVELSLCVLDEGFLFSFYHLLNPLYRAAIAGASNMLTTLAMLSMCPFCASMLFFWASTAFFNV
jgi:hypothetical protein